MFIFFFFFLQFLLCILGSYLETNYYLKWGSVHKVLVPGHAYLRKGCVIQISAMLRFWLAAGRVRKSDFPSSVQSITSLSANRRTAVMCPIAFELRPPRSYHVIQNFLCLAQIWIHILGLELQSLWGYPATFQEKTVEMIGEIPEASLEKPNVRNPVSFRPPPIHKWFSSSFLFFFPPQTLIFFRYFWIFFFIIFLCSFATVVSPVMLGVKFHWYLSYSALSFKLKCLPFSLFDGSFLVTVPFHVWYFCLSTWVSCFFDL